MVRISTALALAAGALTARAQSNSEINDDVILQYALTLEHLEAAFYSEALQKLSANDFAAGGEQHALFQQIAGHEAAHVALLQSVLGDKATKACTYNFPYTNVQGFKALAQVLEGVGVSAYLGAAQYITNPAYLTAAGSILTIEARHAAWLAATNAENPWPGPNDTPLGFSSVYSLAAGFITSCPDSNPKLPVKAFPTLTASNATNLKADQSITLTLPGDFNATSGATYYAAFLNGLTPLFVPYTANQSVKIPAVNATGTVYVVITTSNSSATDENIVAGPAVLHFDAGYPSGISAGSSTGSGSGAPGTDGNGNPSTGGGSGSGNGSGSGGDGASSLTTSWIVAAAGAFAALLVVL